MGGIVGFSKDTDINACRVERTVFAVEGYMKLLPYIGHIVGWLNGGSLSNFGVYEIQVWESSAEGLNDNKDHYFRVGWGFAGYRSNSPTCDQSFTREDGTKIPEYSITVS